jgi:hypothetical protein
VMGSNVSSPTGISIQSNIFRHEDRCVVAAGSILGRSETN